MATISVFIEKTNNSQYLNFAIQFKHVDVVLDDPFWSMFLFVEGMDAVLFPVAIAKKIGNNEFVHKAQQTGLFQK